MGASCSSLCSCCSGAADYINPIGKPFYIADANLTVVFCLDPQAIVKYHRGQTFQIVGPARERGDEAVPIVGRLELQNQLLSLYAPPNFLGNGAATNPSWMNATTSIGEFVNRLVAYLPNVKAPLLLIPLPAMTEQSKSPPPFFSTSPVPQTTSGQNIDLLLGAIKKLKRSTHYGALTIIFMVDDTRNNYANVMNKLNSAILGQTYVSYDTRPRYWYNAEINSDD